MVSFNCRFCSEEFTSSSELTTHQTRSHAAITTKFQCCLCERKFLTDRDVAEHIKVEGNGHHTFRSFVLFKCPHCSFAKEERAEIAEHMKKCHLKNMVCPICETVQSGLLGCNECGLCYNNMKGLAHHIALKHCRGENGRRRRNSKSFLFYCAFCPIVADELPHFSQHLLSNHRQQIINTGTLCCQLHPRQ